MSVSVTVFANAAQQGVSGGPEVSARADGDVNVRNLATCYVGIQFNTSGTEYEYTPAGAVTDAATWLDSGSSSDVWVMWTRTGGTESDWSLGSGNNNVRLNLGTTRSFRHEDTVSSPVGGAETIIGYFRFYDAASGGNLLQTTSTVTWSARQWHDACPLCCFTPLTPITMADGTTLPIVDVKVGDMIRVQDGIEAVKDTITRDNRPMYLIKFADGRELESSEDHPLYVDGKGYAAVNPDPSINYKDLGVAEILALGDKVLDENGQLNEIVSMEWMDYPETVYTFENSKFYANGMLVY